MEGYRAESYGEGLADVYDEWYHGVSDTAATVRMLDEVARAAAGTASARILELAVGTGRLAIPLAALGHDVTGLDVSRAMLDRLRAADTDGLVTTRLGDMVDDLPPEHYDVVFVAYNSLFMLAEPSRQAACFAAVSRVLGEDGRFVVEAFVPDDPPRPAEQISVRSMTAERVVLTINTTDATAQTVRGQFVDLTHGQPVRLRPYVLRYSTPAELDRFAADAGLGVVDRWQDCDRTEFGPDSAFHVTVYGRTASTAPASAP